MVYVPDYQKEYQKKYREKNPEYYKNHCANLKQHAYNYIESGKIIDTRKWDHWCYKIKSSAKTNNHPYSNNFTNDIMFEMMIKGCFYCGDIAMTIDRIDSKLGHIPENCVGSCNDCNISKGASDPSTFVKKAYYRARGEYYDDDTDIWYVHKNKPYMSSYKRKKVPFDLTKNNWEKLIKGDCEYCHRSPITWFGVDRIVPSRGYIDGNVISCCWDCNNDKFKSDVEMMRARNERIARRVDNGEFVIGEHQKVILHRGTRLSTAVCVHGKVYENMAMASDAYGMSKSYVSQSILSDRYPDDIFVITREFYEEYKDSENITKNMFVAFDYFYTS